MFHKGVNMKLRNIIIIGVVFLIIIVVSLIIIFIILKPKLKAKKNINITNIQKFEFSYTKGYAMNSNIVYIMECEDDCLVTIKPYDKSEQEKVEAKIDDEFIKQLEKILNKYSVSKWDGFDKAAKNVLDGDSFHVYITYDDNQRVSASGYMMWPDRYKNVRGEIDELFMDVYEQNHGIEVDLKPIIYLYPEKKAEVSVKLGYPEKLTVSYPTYQDSWDVIAYPNGTLIDKKTNQELYALFWEGFNTVNKGVQKEGFIVEGKDIQKFLEDKLTFLGLNDKEREEFIIYWLPKLQNNKYNYIRFETMKEQNKNMPLIINPKPDTIIRINMEYKKLEKKIDIQPQKLNKVNRKGFTVVEWGGTILK